MNRIEHRFLIYENFEKEAPTIFNGFCNKFNLKIIDCSIYGIYFSNNRCELSLTSESSSLQLWLKIPKYNISEMIPKLAMLKGDNVYSEYKNIITKKRSKKQMLELTEFLIKNFSNEFNE